jgi:hypothetical protein
MTVTQVATDIGVDPAHLKLALLGRLRPSTQVREQLPDYLGLPIEKLFTADSIAQPPGFGRGGRSTTQVNVVLFRDTERHNGVDVVGQVVELSRPPVPGDVVDRSDGSWLIWRVGRTHDRVEAHLTRPEAANPYLDARLRDSRGVTWQWDSQGWVPGPNFMKMLSETGESLSFGEVIGYYGLVSDNDERYLTGTWENAYREDKR